MALLTILGPLRCVILLGCALAALSAPFAMGEVYYEDWRILPTVVAPTVAVMLAFIVPLDMLMTRVFLGSAEASHERTRLTRVLWIEAASLAVLLLAWTPFFATLVPD